MSRRILIERSTSTVVSPGIYRESASLSSPAPLIAMSTFSSRQLPQFFLEPSPTELYKYRPLETSETIRVIVLQPARNHNEPLDCNIIHQDRREILLDIRDEQHFEAVSYTWGNPELSCKIVCDEKSAFLNITHNVDSFLRHFRAESSVRYLWVDAICLNQVDNDEKSIQVSLMGDIYRQARRILLWLGDASPEDDVQLVFAFLKRLTSIKCIAISKEAIENLSKDVFKYSDITKVQSFLQRPWFQRRWIIQEVALGHDSIVQCGPFRISWHWFVDAMRRLQIASDRGFITLNSEALDSVHNACIIYSHSNELLTLLWDFHKSECCDPRDRIFALHGLAEDVVPSVASETSLEVENSIARKAFPVNYTSPWIKVYRRLALECVAAGNWHVLLKHLFAFGALWEQQQNPKIPSWIPAWNKVREFPDFMADVPPWTSRVPFLEMRETDRNILFFGRGTGRKVISISNEWPPTPEMNVILDYAFSKVSIVFHVLAFALAKGLVNLSITDQETKDLLAPQMTSSGERTTWPWSRLARKLETLSQKQDASTGGPLVLGILELMKTYSLLKWEGNIIGIGRGDIQIGDTMVHTLEIVWRLDFLPTFCMRPIAQSLLLSDHTSSSDAEEQEWRMGGPAFVLLDGIWEPEPPDWIIGVMV